MSLWNLPIFSLFRRNVWLWAYQIQDSSVKINPTECVLGYSLATSLVWLQNLSWYADSNTCTRKHSSTMRTVRCSGRGGGGVCPGKWEVSAHGVLARGCLPRGCLPGRGGGCIPACTKAETLPWWTEFLTHACENIIITKVKKLGFHFALLLFQPDCHPDIFVLPVSPGFPL